MNPLFDTLKSWLGGRAARVLHVGAGSGAVLDAYQSLGCAHVVLAEGDPDLAAALSVRAAAIPGVEVDTAVLAPDAGALLWNRYNLRVFNGPLDASPLVALYPRLQALSTLPVQATGFPDWVQAHLAIGTDSPQVLVLDVPGQEQALLAALSAEVMWHFDAVLVRGCGRPPTPAWNRADATHARLLGLGFRLQTAPGDQDPLWPVHLFAQDVAERERAAQRDEIVSLREALELARHHAEQQAASHAAASQEQTAAMTRATEVQQVLQQQLEVALRERDEQTHWHQENARWAQGLKAENEALNAQLAALQEELVVVRRQADDQAAVHAAASQEHAAALDQSTEALARATEVQLALQQQLEAARRERDEQAHWHQENAQRAQGLSAEKEALSAQLAALQEALDAAHRQADDQAAVHAAASQEHTAALAQAAEAQQALQLQLEAAQRERDEQAHWHQENARWAQGLKTEKEALNAQLAALQEALDATRRQADDQAAAHAAANQEHGSALAQAQDQAQATQRALQQQLDVALRERDDQAHWHQENAKWAQGLKAEKEALERSLSEARAAQEALASRLAERDARQRLLDAEILRAEAQLDLIKDVLIREKNF